MKISIVCVGKLKETYFRDAVSEYQKRLCRYCRLDIVQVDDEASAENASEAMMRSVKAKEGQRILAKLPENAFVCALDIGGKKMDSVEFANWMERTFISASGTLAFVIGGSLGLDEEVLRRADMRLSFSDMTFPHQLMRVILMEQIYRGFRILHHEPYHK